MFDIDYQKKSQNIIDWIRETVTTTGCDRVVVGLSGGIDSALTAALTTRSLGKEKIYVLIMPYAKPNSSSVKDAKTVAAYLKIPQQHIVVINIKKSVDAIWSKIKGDNYLQIRKGNVMARVRMICLFDFAKKINGLVCGTENKTEHYLGYFTRFGDAASDIEPIRSLYKTQVWEMAKYLGIPKKIIHKAPTAGLWEMQTDEGELGFTYKDADKVLYYYFDEKLHTEEIVKKGISQEIVVKVLEHVAKNDFKHKLPYVYK